jgi:hypothetical protein
MNALRPVLLALLLLLSGPALAETWRLAVVVGNNAGSGERPSLHFAETDAGKLARVLVELGGVAPENLFLLQGRGLEEVRRALARAEQRVRRWHEAPSTRVILTFYFSGHSDGEALELGGERLRFSDLRAWLDATRADVQVALVDSCRSGALLTAKGGALGPAFQVRLTDELASSGQVLLTSSAADEVALESREVGGGIFTHHFVSGLRGAADSSGDGRVTLAEAYQYAFSRTVTQTTSTFVGAQHPAYDYRLSGRGELVLTELSRPDALLELPDGFERALVAQAPRDQVIAELVPGAARRVAVTPGAYAVRLVRGGRVHAGRVEVRAGQTRAVTWEELAALPRSATAARGGQLFEEKDSPWTVLVMGGVQGAVARGLGPVPGARVALRRTGGDGWGLAAQVASGRGEAFRETSLLGWLGHGWGTVLGPVSVAAGVEVGGGAVVQRVAPEGGGWSGMVGGAGWAGATLPLGGQVSLAVEAQLPLLLLRRDGQLTAAALPGTWVGLTWRR